jgi:two-component system, NtrC family, response regulator HydG
MTEKLTRILVVDDHFEMAETVAAGLDMRGFSCTPLGTAAEAIATIAQGHHDALICDLRIPGTDGLELLAQSRAVRPDSPVIVMTAFSGIDTAVESIRRGAYHYLTKPFKVDELLLFLRRALDESALRREARSLREAFDRPLDGIVGDSPAMRDVFTLLRRVANSSAPVLILGETGTGKGLVARALHRESRRAEAPFVVINCAAIPEALLESELFGHVKGAFTGAISERGGLFQQAHRGTLFLDEIAELTPSLQAKLLRVLETGLIRPVGATVEEQVDVRIVAATHRSLRQRAKQGLFREDLMYRLDVVSVELPPLRQRTEDLAKLVTKFAQDARLRNPDSPPLRFSPAVMDALTRYTWPGNVRELEHVIERLTLLCPNGVATLNDLPKAVTAEPESHSEIQFGERVIPMRELQRRYAVWALQRLGGAKMATCERLGVDAKTLKRWLTLDGSED